MIVFGSQRGGGGDLATHLSNAEDNEYVERVEGRGSIADDTHGAFAEWEAIAHSMTKCKNYMYSLSINPDPKQGTLTHEQFMDYIERAEERLGLHGQPREIYQHIKPDRSGELRDHFHVVWSRIDIQDGRAIPISFDKQKLMALTREFALDHGLKLPDGYHTGKAKAPQLSLYEKAQQDQTGLTREERKDVVTKLWQSADSPSAFVAALSDQGYILATGKRPYVLVDVYGHTNALPKLIDDKQVRTKDVQAYLEGEYPTEHLPSVDEAKEIANQHRRESQTLELKERHAGQLEILERSQDQRRSMLTSEIEQTANTHQLEREQRIAKEQNAHRELSEHHTSSDLQVQFQRAHNDPKGLAAFLAKVSGVSLIRKKLQEREDRSREQRQHDERAGLELGLRDTRQLMDLRQNLEMRELHRRQRAQEHVFTREKRTLSKSMLQEQARQYRLGHDHMPTAALTLTPGGRRAMPHLAKSRFTQTTAKELNVKAKPKQPEEPVDLGHDFRIAARQPGRDNSGSGKPLDREFSIKQPGKERKR